MSFCKRKFDGQMSVSERKKGGIPEKWWRLEKNQKIWKKLLTKVGQCDNLSKLSARTRYQKRTRRAAEKNFEKSRKKFLTKSGRCAKIKSRCDSNEPQRKGKAEGEKRLKKSEKSAWQSENDVVR